MPAPKGNQFWKMRSSHGRNPIFDNPEQLWEAACEYFDWVDKNPLKEQKVFHANGKITKTTVTKMRAMTIVSLCLFLGITKPTWDDYKAKEDFSSICEDIENIIRTQKFQGASADLLNASIIARELGLVDKQERDTTLKGDKDNPLVWTNVYVDAKDVKKEGDT